MEKHELITDKRTKKVLIVEDNRRLAASICKGLSEAGYDAYTGFSGAEAIPCAEKIRPDMIILDLGLPDIDGIDLLAALRGKGMNCPVLILTARDTLNDKIKGLDSGADDYLVKPFAFTELLARINALLRRTDAAPDLIKIDGLTIDIISRAVSRSGKPVDLTPKEFDLLLFLAINRNTVVSREMIAKNVWHITSRATPIDSVIDVHMSNLRRKIDGESSVKLLHVVRSIGITLREEL
jgi:DNA-binding response OmpR family regulator